MKGGGLDGKRKTKRNRLRRTRTEVRVKKIERDGYQSTFD